MAASDDLIKSIADSAQAITEGKVRRFREHETEAEFHSLGQVSELLKTLTDEEVRAAIDGAGGPAIKKFRPICG